MNTGPDDLTSTYDNTNTYIIDVITGVLQSIWEVLNTLKQNCKKVNKTFVLQIVMHFQFSRLQQTLKRISGLEDRWHLQFLEDYFIFQFKRLCIVQKYSKGERKTQTQKLIQSLFNLFWHISMMLWHPLLVHLQEDDLIQATSSSAALWSLSTWYCRPCRWSELCCLCVGRKRHWRRCGGDLWVHRLLDCSFVLDDASHICSQN